MDLHSYINQEYLMALVLSFMITCTVAKDNSLPFSLNLFRLVQCEDRKLM
jgi:hypothetical protein